ncbi:MAG TPA: pyridoxal-phosphate dependent enzyme [Chitinophagaceae bacterium]|nr:pyridoxal-phosphate dependent enzyme [Chitinophagaceae bacterium]
MNDILYENISVDNLTFDEFNEKNIRVSVLRLDKIHPFISGNKWFKLRFYLDEARNQNKKSIVTFGGAWSNHILATAAACRIEKFSSTGIIRGEAPATLSLTLEKAKELDMQLVFVSRDEYKQKNIPEEFQKKEYFFIPEGGYGELGVKGASTILDHFDKEDFSHICCAVGTGTMMGGLINASSEKNFITGISVLKNNFGIDSNVKLLVKPGKENYGIIHDYHFGGYAKYKPELISFMNSYYSRSNIPSDFVYTGKLFFAIADLIQKNYFPSGSRILIIHSGGLQGNDSLEKGTLIF